MKGSGNVLFRLTAILETVKKTTGGRAWNKPWGFTGYSKTQRRNRKKQIKQEHSVMEALRQAAAAEPPAAQAVGAAAQT